YRLVEPPGADDRDRAGPARHLVRLLDRRPETDGLERVVDAPSTREVAHGGDRVARAGVDGVGSAAVAGQRELRCGAVDRNDLRGARHARSLNRREPDAAAA